MVESEESVPQMEDVNLWDRSKFEVFSFSFNVLTVLSFCTVSERGFAEVIQKLEFKKIYKSYHYTYNQQFTTAQIFNLSI